MLAGMNTTARTLPTLLLAGLLAGGLARDSAGPARPEPAVSAAAPAPSRPQPPAALPVTEGKRVPLNPIKTLLFETFPDGRRRVLIKSEVCLREGMLEVFLCRKLTKEHEAILHAELD